MGVRVVASGVAAAAEVHHRVIELLHLLAVQVAFALLRDNALDDTLLRVVVVGYRVGVVLVLVLLEEGATHHLAGGVGGAVGMEGLLAEVNLHTVSLEDHLAVVYLALAVEEGAPRLEVHRHRVARLVLHQLVDGVGRDAHQRVYIGLSYSTISTQTHHNSHKDSL